MLPPKRFKQNTTKATEIKRNGTEAIGIDQDGIAKSIDIEVLMTKDNVGLGDVDNTSDADKPVSTAQQGALDNKADKDTDAVVGNFASFDANGNPIDSGKKDADYEDADTTILKKAQVKDNLTSTNTDLPLSANQGKVLKDGQDELAGAGWAGETVKKNADDISTLNADDATEGSVAKTVKDAVEPIIEDVSDHEMRIAVLEGWHPLNSWDDIQKVAKAGVARKYLKVGDLVETSYDGSPAVVELIGINHPFDIPPVGVEYGDVLSWGFKDCLQNAQYSAPQALFNAVEGLSAGTYTFINPYTSLPCTFTLTQAVPAGGVIVITSWGEPYNPLVIKTMQADRLTDIETGVAVTQDSGGTALAPVNLTPRCRYGANLYIESGIRHFLNDNSDSYLWVAQGLYDMPSTYGAGGGFIKRLDADFASVIGPVVKKVARATADGGGQDTMEDKVWLLSRVEMGYGTEGVTTGEQVYERWNGATNAERIKLLSGSPRPWWLRPPLVSHQNHARRVYTDGTLDSNYSYNSFGLAPGLAVY